MDSDLVDTEPCQICDRPARHHIGRVCTACYSRLKVALDSLPHLAGEAANWIEDRPTNVRYGRTVPSSRPPLNLDAVDPALALIELVPGDKSSSVTVLEALESWVRVVRDENSLVPYGVATETDRDPLSPQAALAKVCRFLGVWLDWMARAEPIDVADFNLHVSESRRVLSRWSWEAEPKTKWRVACPSITMSGGECGCLIHFVGLEDDEVRCRGCGARWSPARLLAVAASADAESVWVDAEAAAVAVGVDASTVRRWARAGKVRRAGQRYSLADLRECTATRGGVTR